MSKHDPYADTDVSIFVPGRFFDTLMIGLGLALAIFGEVTAVLLVSSDNWIGGLVSAASGVVGAWLAAFLALRLLTLVVTAGVVAAVELHEENTHSGDSGAEEVRAAPEKATVDEAATAAPFTPDFINKWPGPKHRA